MKNQKHSFHLVDPSPWPLISAFSALFFVLGMVLYFQNYNAGEFLMKFGILMILFMMFNWWRDIIREATFEGQHTLTVQQGLKLGVLLFIVSEIMFFFAFFWAFFHSSFNAGLEIGSIWPPFGMNLDVLDPWQIPYLNTLILITSGCTITVGHYAIVLGNKDSAGFSLVLTIVLAIIFTLLQIFEYNTSTFSINDSVYGSIFFMATGFHGFHVFVGTCFIFICLLRLELNHFTKEHHLGFEAAAWYWHFVDVVWLFLFATIYWWGGC